MKSLAINKAYMGRGLDLYVNASAIWKKLLTESWSKGAKKETGEKCSKNAQKCIKNMK